jgi:hypothetical protein
MDDYSNVSRQSRVRFNSKNRTSRGLKPRSAKGKFRTHAPQQILPFATSSARLSTGWAITGLIAAAVSNHACGPAYVCLNADFWVAKPSQAVQYRRD